MNAATTRDDLIEAVYTVLVRERRWHLFPLYDPTNLPTFAEFDAARRAACAAAVDAICPPDHVVLPRAEVEAWRKRFQQAQSEREGAEAR